MSSSIFLETNTVVTPHVEEPESANIFENEKHSVSETDSNLVVVYGKSGVNFDSKAINNLIEEKTLSSISVIRISSPTPSMFEEEEKAVEAEIGLDAESDLSSCRDSATDDGVPDIASDEDRVSGEIDEYSDEGNSTDNYKKQTEQLKKKKKNKANVRGLKLRRKRSSERPEIVGLTVEQFYSQENTKEVVKEALKLAGVSPIKHTAEYQFQLYVIKNDHCYTPFTSPAQMKVKIAEKLKAEKLSVCSRKIIPQTAVTMKQLQSKKKLQLSDIAMDGKQKLVTTIIKDKLDIKTMKDKGNHSQGNLDELIEDEDELYTSEEEQGSNFESEESAESDNDRDSDLDFDVNNRKGRKRKVQKKLSRLIITSKGQSKRQPLPENVDESSPSVSQRVKTARSTSSDNGKSTKPTIVSNVNLTTAASVTKLQKPPQDATATLPPISKKQTSSFERKIGSPNSQLSTTPCTVRRCPIIQVGATLTTSSSQIQSSSQNVKEIIINKAIASPKGGFTDISALLTHHTPDNTPEMNLPSTPTSSKRSIIHALPTPSKGFMRLGIETAAKNQLPAQISVQTHQSSSELAAEHDKQLDLIDSIVNDEMQKSGGMNDQQSEPSVSQNIPELVKMLESTEHALESNKTSQLNNFTSAATVEDIDISNAPLLEAPDDDIPDDLLQHVVELIEDDKTLQEAVEKQVFGDDSSEIVSGIGTVSTSTTPPPLVPLFQQEALKTTNIAVERPLTLKQHETQTKSIIQMAISNVAPVADVSRVIGIHTPKIAPLIRKEPIQIVRGNGRVITLPPIEAPTTRAKRRAQTQPTQQNLSTSGVFNESSMDSSLHSNSSITAPDTAVTEKIQSDASGARRRVSKEGATAANTSTSSGTNKSGKKKTSSATIRKNTANKTNKNDNKNETEVGGSESQEDDDDPKKLWCICRQPHNNRFMICCDVCEDWFHGTCVSITKAMGLEMEQKGIDWTCPKCVKKQEEKKQRKITDMLLSTRKTITVPVAPVTVTTPLAQIVYDNAKETRNVLPAVDVSLQSSSLDAISVVSPKIEVPHKKQLITIKKIAQDEQFTPLKSLEISKSPNTVMLGIQKKLSTSNTNPKPAQSPSATLAKRVVVIQNSVEQKISAEPLAGKLATVLNKSVTNQRTKVQKVPIYNSPVEPPTLCIVCKKIARPNSIYCSDDCIRKHAQNALNVFSAKSPEPMVISPQTKTILEDKKKKSKGLFEDLLSMADLKPKVERVNVFERKSGRVFTGSSAPTTQNLKKWLQDNPTFEVVQPGSTQAIEIEKKTKQRFLQSSSPTVNKSFANVIPVSSHHQTTISQVHATTVPAIPIHKNEGHDPTTLAKPVKQFLEVSKSSPSGLRPSTPKQLQKYPQHVNLKPDKVTRSEFKEETKPKEKNIKRHSTEIGIKKSTENVSSTTDSEPIRLNVRRTLKDQLLVRMREVGASQSSDAAMGEKDNAVHLTPGEVEEFITATESEMYNYFNRDTGSKYKAKYRSLMFNIKDRKNQTLFAKICAKLVEPKQLVRMSPEELASQELAQWRENEAKHQLEMIKKSELDLLSCAKNYVLKTHKGEEVIEGKSADCVNLDLAIPVEDVVSVLNNAVAVTSSDTPVYDASAAIITTALTRKDHYHPSSDALDASCSHHAESHRTSGIAENIEEKSKSSSKERERERSKEKERDRGYDRRHKNKDHHHKDKSRSRRRSCSHSRSRSRSREKRHKTLHKDERRSDREERERKREGGSGRNREGEHRLYKEETEKKLFSEQKQPTKISQKEINRENPLAVTAAKKSTTPKPVESYSLIDQILESTKTVEEAANLVSEKDKEKEVAFRQPNSTLVASAPIQSAHSHHHHHSHHHQPPHVTSFVGAQGSADSDQEPSSTVSIATPPQDPYIRYSGSDSPVPCGNILSSSLIWGGNINMIDVASFQIILQSVAGNTLNLGKLLPEELDVVGRIGPDTVWDYISKIKKSPNKEIVIIRLVPSSESETVAYTILYQYLDKRNRLGVIKTTSAQIKDFYIFPLGAGKEMPSILQSAERVEFYEDPYRPDLLVGIVIRVIGKRTSSVVPVLPANPTSAVAKFSRRGNEASDSLTPPGSPKRKKRTQSTAPKGDEIDVDAIIKAPIAAKINKSATVMPNTESMDDANEPYSPGGSSGDDVPLLPVKAVPEGELKRKMDELNRQIAAQEMEIAGLLNVEPSRFASSSSTTSTVLANISIPSNLSQILASIKGKLPESTVPPTQPSAPTSLTAVPPPPLIGSLVTTSTADCEEEYNPEAVSYDTSVKSKERSSITTTSRLAQLSEEELLSMVPDDMIEQPSSTTSHSAKAMENKARYEEPPPPPGV